MIFFRRTPVPYESQLRYLGGFRAKAGLATRARKMYIYKNRLVADRFETLKNDV